MQSIHESYGRHRLRLGAIGDDLGEAAQLVVFKEESGGCTAVPQCWGKRMNKKFGVTEAPDWWSEELGAWVDKQWRFGKAFKKPASERSKAEKINVSNTTERHVALLDGFGLFT